MGYCISMIDSDFRMKAESKPAALQALKDMWDDETNMSGGSWGSGGQKEQKWFAWMNNSDIQNCVTFEQAMNEWRYPVTLSVEGHGAINDIDFEGEKIGDEELMFNAIAPFVEADSYITMLGEDGEQWRYFFDGETMETLFGRTVFE